MRTSAIWLMMLLLLPAALAYQHSRLVFTLDGWTVFEQRSASQSFKKQDLYLEVHSYSDKADLASPQEFAGAFNGSVHTNATAKGSWQEFVVTTSERAFVHARLAREGEQYAVTLIAPKSKLSIAKQEMQTFYSGVSFSAEKKVVLASWEEPLLDPEGLPFFTAHPIPWTPLLLAAALGGFVFWRRKRRTKPAQPDEPKQPEKAAPKKEEPTPP